MLRFFKRFAGSSSTSTSPRRSVRPQLEVLEDRSVPTVAAGPHGEVFATFYDKNSLYERPTTGGWQFLNASDLTSVSVGANGTVAGVCRDASLRLYSATTGKWQVVDNNVGIVSVGPQGQLWYTRGNAERLVERDSTGVFTLNVTGVTSISAGPDGTVDVVLNTGVLQQLTGGKTGSWHQLGASGFTAVAQGMGVTYGIWGDTHAVYDLKPGGLWQSLNASSVTAISAGADGTMDAIFSGNGSCWQWNSATRQWGAKALFTGANTDPAGPSLAQHAVQFGLDHVGQPTSDNGTQFECANFVLADLEAIGAKTTYDYGVSGADADYVWGNLAVQHNAGGALSDFNLIKPGDVLQFRNVVSTVKITNPDGSWYTQSWSFPHHSAIVYQNNGSGKLVVLEQNANGQHFVTKDKIDLSGMTSGTIWDYHVVAK
jgi:hypothetical protein